MSGDALFEPVSKYVRLGYIVLEESSRVQEAVKAMRENGYGSVIVTKEGKPVGILTERDVLYRVVAEGKDPKNTRIGEVMTTPLITVTPNTKVSDAIAIMSKKGIRRLVVMSGEKIMGIISLMALVGDSTGRSVLLPEVEAEERVKCPYCGAVFGTVGELSKHIDRVHIGFGLLSEERLR